MSMPIITLGRQFGSGGRVIGHQLAEKWNIPCYDRELITLAAKKAEVHEELFTGKDEKAANSWLYTGVYEGGSKVQRGQSAEDILFDMQSQVILDLAQKGPCIIIDGCADVVLRSAGFQIVSLFVCVPFPDRVKRRIEIEGVAQKKYR
ncbi:cytidylate kinase-like family protein [Candidatus Agathobaculum pullicola]|uniref:cytidylate kinase-like family protein n=1 Tax=Candidatus Agathobaculum pullicola TaxID=2838426 RepID=UPI003F903B68